MKQVAQVHDLLGRDPFPDCLFHVIVASKKDVGILHVEPGLTSRNQPGESLVMFGMEHEPLQCLMTLGDLYLLLLDRIQLPMKLETKEVVL